jgi:hypothetical protein
MEPIEENENGLDLKAYLPEKWYNFLKWLNLIAIPAAVTAYLGLSDVMDLPNPAGVSAAAMVLMTLMGTLLGLSQARYDKLVDASTKGTIVVTEEDGQISYNLQVAVPPEKIKDLSTLTFDVQKAV